MNRFISKEDFHIGKKPFYKKNSFLIKSRMIKQFHKYTECRSQIYYS